MGAKVRDAGLAELDTPLDEELTERVRQGVRGLGMQDSRLVVGMERRDARLVAELDAAIGDGSVELANLGVLDVDPDPGRDQDLSPSTKTSR